MVCMWNYAEGTTVVRRGRRRAVVVVVAFDVLLGVKYTLLLSPAQSYDES